MSGTRGAGGRRTWLTRVVAAAAVLLAGATALVLLADAGGDAPRPERGPTTLALVVPVQIGAQRCMVPTVAVLGEADVAFAGEVAEVADGTVRLRPDRFYAGGPADEVVVSRPTDPQPHPLGAVAFEEGGRYLVAANAGQVMVCGFSGPHDPELVELYEDAFGR